MIIAQGNVADQPFARTIFSLAAKRFTGDLVLTKSRQDYRSSWENGQIVAALSASPADSPGRIALANGLVNSSILGVFVKERAAQPHRDPTELLVEIAKLSPEQGITLKRRGLARCAARIFALPAADFVVDNARSLRADGKVPALDVRWLIYFGLRTHYPTERLAAELEAVGERSLHLPAEVLPMLPVFAFGDVEDPILRRLMGESLSLSNLVSACGDIDPATTTCVVYALMACGYLALGEAQSPRSRTRSKTMAGSSPAGPTAPQPTPSKPSSPRSAASQTVQGIGFIETMSKPVQAPASPSARRPAANRRSSSASTTTAATRATTELIETKIALLDQDANYYAFLGLEVTADDASIRKRYFDLARKLHPDRMQAIGLLDKGASAERLFAAINKAFAVLSNPKEVAKYREVVAAGGEKAFAKKQQVAEELAISIFRAEEHFHVGEMALRRDQFAKAESEFKNACDLSPDESEYLALYAWAMYCNAPDRGQAGPIAMNTMSSALQKGPKSETTRLYHARLLKLMDRPEEALESFRILLRMNPEHRDAELEIRLLSNADKQDADAKKGLFGRKR